ncbi:ABC transporter permease [Rubripirellula sp.]|nr:ABC transporter permease [Rubripirellula sp.]
MNTISAAWALAQKDLRSFLRDRTALVLSILVPIALVSVFGWIMAYAFGGSSGMPKVMLHVADFSQSESSQKFVDSLKKDASLKVRVVNLAKNGNSIDQNAAQGKLEKLIRDGDANHVLILPSDMEQQMAEDKIPQLNLLRDPGRSMEEQVIQIALLQTSSQVFGGVFFTDAMDRMLTKQGMDPQNIGLIRTWMTDIGSTMDTFYKNNDPSSDPANQDPANQDPANQDSDQAAQSSDPANHNTGESMLGFMEDLMPVETKDISPPDRGKQVTFQQAQSVAGMTVMMLLFALTSCGSVLLTEREEGTLKRLFSQPISWNAILLGKFLFVLMVGFGQMAILFTYGEWMFRVGLFRDPITLIVLSFSWVVTGGAFGMFLASISRSSKQAESLASLLILMMAALGGCWFPLQMMNLPTILDTVCRSTMTYWAMTGFQNMLWNQLSWHDTKVLQALGWQWCWAAVLTLGAIIFFRRNYCRG